MNSETTGENGYVSKFLTHFVGQRLKENEAFDLLCKIIREGELLPGGSPANRDGNVKIDQSKPFSSNDLLSPEMVCFCDIPLNPKMLRIHTQKYSKFGLAFDKIWLAQKLGASPVLYLSEGSGCTDHRFPNDPYRGTDRKAFFDLAAGDWLKDHKKDLGHRPRPGDNLVFWYLLCYCKFFDETLSKEDKANHYMEREWRTIRSVPFEHNNIGKVILPEDYKERFVSKFPELKQQVQEISL